MKSIIYISLLLVLAACGAGEGGVTVDRAWIRTPTPNASVLAGYGVIENSGEQAVMLRAITSDAFDAIMLHRTEVQNGMATMEAVDSLTLPAGGRAVLHPGGLHMMLMKPAGELQPGEVVPITLNFEGHKSLTVPFVVRNSPPD